MAYMRLRVLYWLVLGAGLAALPAKSASPDTSGNLWRVVQLCTANKTALGLPFPCLEVNLARGYVVLRPPFGKPDTILAPTSPSSGIEDASLQTAGAINYFDLAWKARGSLAGKTSRALAFDDIGLAVNASGTRSQNQLHIHIECLAADIKLELQQAETGISQKGWTKLRRPLRHLDFWARRIYGDELGANNPFALTAQELPMARGNMGNITLVVAGAKFRQGARGFLLLAADTKPHRGHTGEDLLDHACAG